MLPGAKLSGPHEAEGFEAMDDGANDDDNAVEGSDTEPEDAMTDLAASTTVAAASAADGRLLDAGQIAMSVDEGQVEERRTGKASPSRAAPQGSADLSDGATARHGPTVSALAGAVLSRLAKPDAEVDMASRADSRHGSAPVDGRGSESAPEDDSDDDSSSDSDDDSPDDKALGLRLRIAAAPRQADAPAGGSDEAGAAAQSSDEVAAARASPGLEGAGTRAAADSAPRPAPLPPSGVGAPAAGETLAGRTAATAAPAAGEAGPRPGADGRQTAPPRPAERGAQRAAVVRALFRALAASGASGAPRASEAPMGRFATLNGFDGSGAEWEKEYTSLCREWSINPADGFCEATFSKLVDDKSEKGCYCSDQELLAILRKVQSADVAPRERSRSRSSHRQGRHESMSGEGEKERQAHTGKEAESA